MKKIQYDFLYFRFVRIELLLNYNDFIIVDNNSFNDRTTLLCLEHTTLA